MNPFASIARRWIGLPAAAALLLASLSGARVTNAAPPPPDTERVRQAVSDTLSHYGPPGARLLAASVDGSTIHLNFTRELLAGGNDATREQALEAIFASVDRLSLSTLQDVGFDLQVEGQPLSAWLAVPKAEAAVQRGQAWLTPAGNPDSVQAAAVNSAMAVVSPGHGWIRRDNGTWDTQRGYWWGIIEDFVNWEIAAYVDQTLSGSNLDVRPARNPDKQAGIGESGHDRWQEGAKYYVKSLGAPEWVWNSDASRPNFDENQDIRSRPFYANYLNSTILVSVHNNGAPDGVTASGTEIWYDDCNDYVDQSIALATAVRARLISTLRQYDANWPDRGLKHACWAHGENHLATRPSIIVELAFMNTQTPDNQYLHDERFKQLAGQGIANGMMDYLGVFSDSDDNRHLASGRTLTGTLSPAGDDDVYTFYAQSGWLANVTVTALDGDLQPTVAVYRADDGSLNKQDLNPNGANSATVTRAPVSDTGWNRINVRSVGGHSSGRYTVTLDLVSQASDQDDGRYLVPKLRALGTISPNDDFDVYFFNAQAHQAATLRMDALSSDLDPFLHLYGPDGKEVVFDDDSGGEHNALINVQDLPLSGRYRVMTNSWHNSSSGNYELRFTLQNTGTISDMPTAYYQYMPLK